MWRARPGLGAGEHEAPVGHVRQRRPHLLPGDHPLVAVEHRAWWRPRPGRSRRPARSSPGTTAPSTAAIAGQEPAAAAPACRTRSASARAAPRRCGRPGRARRLRAYSSWKMTCCRSVAPRPPCSAGQPRQVQPAAASCRFQASRSSNASCSRPGPPAPRSPARHGGRRASRATRRRNCVVFRLPDCMPLPYQALAWYGSRSVERDDPGDDPGRGRATRPGSSATRRPWPSRRRPAQLPGAARAGRRGRPGADRRRRRARRPGRGLVPQHAPLGARRARRADRRRHPGPGQHPVHRPRGARRDQPQPLPGRWSSTTASSASTGSPRCAPRRTPIGQRGRARAGGAGRRRRLEGFIERKLATLGPYAAARAGAVRPGRRQRHPVHLRHHRAQQGRDERHRQALAVARAWAELGGLTAATATWWSTRSSTASATRRASWSAC